MSNSLFSRLTFLSLILFATMGSNSLVLAQPEVKFSRVINNDDPRYIGVLAAGGCVTLAGIIAVFKSLKSEEQVVVVNGKYPVLEDISNATTKAIKCGAGLALTAAGLLVVVNSKNIPGYFEVIGKMPTDSAF